MSDKEFDLRPTERRERKQFEPPPWEKDQFEEMERQRAEQAPPVDLDAVLPQVTPAQALAADAVAVPDVRQAATPSAEAPAKPAPAAGAVAAGEGASVSAKPLLDERRVSAMLVELAAQEPDLSKVVMAPALVLSFISVAIGAVLLLWGMVMLVRGGANTLGVVGGAGVGIFGAMFIGAGIWLVARTLRRRGVL